MADRPARVQSLVRQAAEKLGSDPGGKFRAIKDQVLLAIEMLREWMSGSYQLSSNRTVIVLIAALLYFVVPFDVIPDFLFGIGFIDDAAVLGYVFNQINEEVEAYKVHRAAQVSRE